MYHEIGTLFASFMYLEAHVVHDMIAIRISLEILLPDHSNGRSFPLQLPGVAVSHSILDFASMQCADRYERDLSNGRLKNLSYLLSTTIS